MCEIDMPGRERASAEQQQRSRSDTGRPFWVRINFVRIDGAQVAQTLAGVQGHMLSGYAGRGEQLNAVAIEEAISQLADQPFDSENFPYAFLEALGNKETTTKRRRAGASNKSDLGGVLQTNYVHIATCDMT